MDGRTLAHRYQNFLSQQGQTLTGAETLLEKLTDEGYRILEQPMVSPIFRQGVWLIPTLHLILNKSLSQIELVFKNLTRLLRLYC